MFRWKRGRCPPSAAQTRRSRERGWVRCWVNTKLSLKSADEPGMPFRRGVAGTFSHPALTGPPFGPGAQGDSQKAARGNDGASHVPLFKAVECFQSERKMEKTHNHATFRISSKPGCQSLCSCYDNSSSPLLPLHLAVSKPRTMTVGDQKMGRASG